MIHSFIYSFALCRVQNMLVNLLRFLIICWMTSQVFKRQLLR
jgi:hypothetical protein